MPYNMYNCIYFTIYLNLHYVAVLYRFMYIAVEIVHVYQR